MKRISVLLLALAVAFSLTVMPAFAQSKDAGKAAKAEQKDSKKAESKKADTKKDDKKADAKKKKGGKKK
jgi:predicted RND superfamily exporter protein